MGNNFRIPLEPNWDSKQENHLSSRYLHGYTSYFWNNRFQEYLPIYPAGFETVTRRTPTWYQDHCSRHFMLVIAPEGKVIYRSGEQIFPLSGSQLLIIPQGTPFYFETAVPAFYRKQVLFILGVNLDGILETLNLRQMELIRLPDLPEVEKRFLELGEQLSQHDEKQMPQMAAKVMELLYYLSEKKASADPETYLARLIKSKLSVHLEHPDTIGGIARELHISTRMLNRIFREKFAMTPEQYRLQCRMEKARNMLEQSRLSIKEISQMLGYCNQFYFSSEFKRVHGVSPLNFRRKKRD